MQSHPAEFEEGCKLDFDRVTKRAMIPKARKAEVGLRLIIVACMET